MTPSVNETCKFSFADMFNTLDGIYTVTSIYSMDELRAIEVNLLDEIFKPLGIDVAVYDTDTEKIESSSVFRLKHAMTSNIVYMPNCYFKTMPDPNVRRYMRLGLAVDIGIFDEPETVAWIKNQLFQVLESVGVVSVPELFEVEYVWLTNDDYTDIKEARDSASSGPKTHFESKQELLAENTRLKTVIKNYETTMKALMKHTT